MIKEKQNKCLSVARGDGAALLLVCLLLIFKAVSGFSSVYSVNSTEGDGSPAAVATETHQQKPESLKVVLEFLLPERNSHNVYCEERKVKLSPIM